MCGIAGFFNFANPSQRWARDDLLRLMAPLHYRGPDTVASAPECFLNSDVGLGFYRLALTGLENGKQPIVSTDKQRVVVCNGEIYNHRDLADLKERASEESRGSDASVLLGVGTRTPLRQDICRLNGMFAFAYWEQAERALILARDHLGQKPLYYCLSEKYFAFASEPKALLALDPSLAEIKESNIARYLCCDYVPANETIYRKILKLPAGSMLRVEITGRATIEQYYHSIDYLPLSSNENRLQEPESELAAHHQLRSLLESAVSRCLEAELPLGFFLSGGLDSSLVASLARRHFLAGEQFTFSLGFDAPEFDESKYSQEVANYLGTRHHCQTITGRDALFAIEELSANLDEPFADASLIPTYILSRLAKTRVQGVLSGDGGDELFAGYPTFLAARYLPLLRLLAPLEGAARPWLERVAARGGANFGVSELLLRGLSGAAAATSPEQIAQRWLACCNPETLWRVLSPELLSRVDAPLGHLSTKPASEVAEFLPRLTQFYLGNYLEGDILTKLDRASMFNGLEVRAPFLDKQLVQYALALPFSLKIRALRGKYLLRSVAEDFLPQSIVRRKKRGFSLPLARWLRAELRELLQEMLSPAELRVQGYFNAEFVSQLLQEHLECRRDHRRILWSLLCFQLWLRGRKALH